MNLVLTAGEATRLKGIAPYGCKSLTPVAGRPIIEWQLDVLGEATIVCQTVHARLLERYGDVVCCDRKKGPADALLSALDSGSVTVVYGDSWFSELPDGDCWVGVQKVQGGRMWDVVGAEGLVESTYLNEDTTGVVCVGLYRFPDAERLRFRIETVAVNRTGELGMAPVINNLVGLDFLVIPSWRDVGDPEALERFRHAA